MGLCTSCDVDDCHYQTRNNPYFHDNRYNENRENRGNYYNSRVRPPPINPYYNTHNAYM